MPHRRYRQLNYCLVEMIVIAVLLLLFAGTAAALHEIDHRYEVRGYILDRDKKPMRSLPVSILLNEQLIGSGRTDGEGYYSIRVHLHDADIGKKLTVRAGSHQAEIRMNATRGDASTQRIHHVNFVAGSVSEKKLAGVNIPIWAYVAGAPIVLWGAIYATGVTRRRLRKIKKARASEKSGKGKKAKGKAKH